MARYKVVSADEAVKEVEFDGGALAVGTHVELTDEVAAPLVEAGKIVADPLAEAPKDWVGNHVVE